MVNEKPEQEYFMIEIVYWIEGFWDKYAWPCSFKFGPYPSKEEMNSNLHKLRRKFNLSNRKICVDTKWTMRDAAHLDQNGKYCMNEKRLKELNDRPHGYIGYKRILSKDGNYLYGFWKTMKLLNHGDEKIMRAKVRVRSDIGMKPKGYKRVPDRDRPDRTPENLQDEINLLCRS